MLFDIDNTYNFNTISKSVLKPNYEGLKVTSYMGFKQAIKYTGVFNDVVTANRQLQTETGLPLLDPTQVKYILFEDIYGNEVLLAEDWIDVESIVLVEGISMNIRINNITSDDAAIIKNMLVAMNYKDIVTDIITNGN